MEHRLLYFGIFILSVGIVQLKFDRFAVSQVEKAILAEFVLRLVGLAAKTGIKQNTISAWLLEKKEPSIRSLWLLADYFNVDIDYLVGRKDY